MSPHAPKFLIGARTNWNSLLFYDEAEPVAPTHTLSSLEDRIGGKYKANTWTPAAFLAQCFPVSVNWNHQHKIRYSTIFCCCRFEFSRKSFAVTVTRVTKKSSQHGVLRQHSTPTQLLSSYPPRERDRIGSFIRARHNPWLAHHVRS